MGKKEFIRSLNNNIFSRLSIEELETRLNMEEIAVRGEMWTGCSCADYTPPSCRCQAEGHTVPDCTGHLSGGMCPVYSCPIHW